MTAAIDRGAVEGLETSTLDPYVEQAGVKTSFTLDDLGANTLNGWKLTKVTGLPSGWTFKNGKVSGVAAPGTYTLFFTFAKGASTVQASSTFVVDPLPSGYAGTYYGASVLYDPKWPNEFICGRIALTVSSAGKVSGSFTDITTDEKCTFSGTGLVEIDDGYKAKVSGKLGKKSVSFDVYFGDDRSAAFAFALGKKEYWSLNCYRAYGKGSYGGGDPVIADLSGRTLVNFDTVKFGDGGSAHVTSQFVHPKSKKKYTTTVSAQIVRDADTGRLYLPYYLKFQDGSASADCFEVEYQVNDGTGEITYNLWHCPTGVVE